MKKQINYVDLFAGIGGMHLGLQQAAKKKGTKINCLFYSEIDKYCIETYEKNFPNSFNLGDISQIKNKEFEKYKNQVDIVTAGFPCQPFSFAGKKQAFKDENTFESVRISGL